MLSLKNPPAIFLCLAANALFFALRCSRTFKYAALRCSKTQHFRRDIKRFQAIFGSLAAAFLFCLTACGFTPVYKTSADGSKATDALSAITVETPSTLIGQHYKTQLTDLFNPTAKMVEPRYKLTVALNKDKVPLAIQQDRTITRYKIVASASYTLTDIASGAVLGTGFLKREGSFDKVESDYATYISEEDTGKRIVKELAEDTRLRVMALVMKSGE